MYAPSSDSDNNNDLFMKDFKYFKQLKNLDQDSSILYLNKINEANLDELKLKV